MDKGVSRREGKEKSGGGGKQRMLQQEAERTQEVWVGRRGRGDVSGFPLSQMAEVKTKRLIRYTAHIVSTICRSASRSARPVISFLTLCDLGHYSTPVAEERGPDRRLVRGEEKGGKAKRVRRGGRP